MKAFYCHHFVLPLPAQHRFPMAKYERLYRRVAQHADALDIELVEPQPAPLDAIRRAHDADYVTRVLDGTLDAAEIRRIGFPWSPELVERTRRSAGGTMAALEAALSGGRVAVNLAGGTHHAAHARGAGYCVFNDTVVAARHVRALGLAARVLVVDLDVHQGDGTAAMCRDDPATFTFSIHAATNYPAAKETSDLDVALPDGCGDARYLDALAAALPQAIARAEPDAVIYLAGADPYIGDRLGRLALTKAGLAQRDRLVFDACRRHDLALAVSMAGGYAEDVEDIVDIHFATIAGAAAMARAARDDRAESPGLSVT